jgi:hypothetical protein
MQKAEAKAAAASRAAASWAFFGLSITLPSGTAGSAIVQSSVIVSSVCEPLNNGFYLIGAALCPPPFADLAGVLRADLRLKRLCPTAIVDSLAYLFFLVTILRLSACLEVGGEGVLEGDGSSMISSSSLLCSLATWLLSL